MENGQAELFPLTRQLGGLWTGYSSADMWQSNCCLGRQGSGGGGAAGPPVQPSRCYSSPAWHASLSSPGAGLPRRSPLLPGPPDSKWRTTIKQRDGQRGRFRRRLTVARVSGIHSPLSPRRVFFSLICLDGCPLSGAKHDERPWLRRRLCLSCLHLGQW